MDKFEENLKAKLQELQKCQASLTLESCYPCEKLLECELRKSYVDAVYNSMSKGKIDGGFDF
ncbi:hypothetical protein CAV_0490 [Campylobacter avium LMG 24591]|uniref:Uncharacterized protein n=1 Tax=Campylobacter avium LMG 24591 TaxID=522484 RepID=A0A222MX75_9BACT|nr:hypothetical protein [Campylobacter avium]ASQ30156.1 hypothetical protein CAV_0490 [Campylobacter avium LMG 24591]OYD79254.1 hypothetical protein CAV8706_0491 [Campylobacter avium]